MLSNFPAVSPTTRETISRKNKSLVAALDWGLHALLFVTAICVFGLFKIFMPGKGLDASWKFGLNQAVAQGLSFGREVIFTYGPYTSILTQNYHPATDHLMLGGGLYLGVSYGIALFLLTKDSRWYLRLAFWIAMAGLNLWLDPWHQSYALLAALSFFKIIKSEGKTGSSDKAALVLTAVLFFPFGLLVLIKGNYLILCGPIATLSIILSVINKKWKLGLAVAASPILSTIFFWIASGQSILDLPAFFISSMQIISGYTEAMAVDGSTMQIASYLAAVSALLAAVLCEGSVALKSRVVLFCVFFVFLFLTFKHGFVRHDSHAHIAGGAILIAALLFSLTLLSWRTPLVLFVAAFAWMHIDVNFSTVDIFKNTKAVYSDAWNELNNRLFTKNRLQNDFNRALQKLKDQAKFPLFQGTADIYSFNQSYLIASGNIWNPRPIFQSYQAYTSFLAEKNTQHLLGPKAPDTVIFKVEPIDDRIPSMEDGPSWPVLLGNYQPTALQNNFLYLHKAEVETPELRPIGDSTHILGEAVLVPSVAGPVFAEITISPSILGRLANILFKSTQLQILLNLENGTIKTYRIIAETAKSGLVISPLIEDTLEFAMLYAESGYLTDRRVKSFSITPVGGRKLWIDNYRVSFREIDVAHLIDGTKLKDLIAQ